MWHLNSHKLKGQDGRSHSESKRSCYKPEHIQAAHTLRVQINSQWTWQVHAELPLYQLLVTLNRLRWGIESHSLLHAPYQWQRVEALFALSCSKIGKDYSEDREKRFNRWEFCPLSWWNQNEQTNDSLEQIKIIIEVEASQKWNSV